MKSDILSPSLLFQAQRQLQQDPCNSELRAMLVRHYFSIRLSSLELTAVRLTCGKWIPPSKQKHRLHALWIIENDPLSAFAASEYVRIFKDSDPVGSSEAKAIWEKHLKHDSNNVNLLRNAVESLKFVDRDAATELIMRGAILEPDSLEWPCRLKQLKAAVSKKEEDRLLAGVARCQWLAVEHRAANRTVSALEFDELREKYEQRLLDISRSQKTVSGD